MSGTVRPGGSSTPGSSQGFERLVSQPPWFPRGFGGLWQIPRLNSGFDQGGRMKVSAEEIDQARTEKGGWTRETLAKWGVPWPPPKGWRQALIEGRPIPKA